MTHLVISHRRLVTFNPAIQWILSTHWHLIIDLLVCLVVNHWPVQLLFASVLGHSKWCCSGGSAAAGCWLPARSPYSGSGCCRSQTPADLKTDIVQAQTVANLSTSQLSDWLPYVSRISAIIWPMIAGCQTCRYIDCHLIALTELSLSLYIGTLGLSHKASQVWSGSNGLPGI